MIIMPLCGSLNCYEFVGENLLLLLKISIITGAKSYFIYCPVSAFLDSKFKATVRKMQPVKKC